MSLKEGRGQGERMGRGVGGSGGGGVGGAGCAHPKSPAAAAALPSSLPPSR